MGRIPCGLRFGGADIPLLTCTRANLMAKYAERGSLVTTDDGYTPRWPTVSPPKGAHRHATGQRKVLDYREYCGYCDYWQIHRSHRRYRKL